MQPSYTGIGALIVLIQLALQYFNINLADGQIADVVNAIVTVVGALMLVVGQIRRPETSMFVLKR